MDSSFLWSCSLPIGSTSRRGVGGYWGCSFQYVICGFPFGMTLHGGGGSLSGGLQDFLVGQHSDSVTVLSLCSIFDPLVLDGFFFLLCMDLFPSLRATFWLPCRCSAPLGPWVPSSIIPVSGMAIPSLLLIFPVVLGNPLVDLFPFVGCKALAVTVFIQWRVLRVTALVRPHLFPCGPWKLAL